MFFARLTSVGHARPIAWEVGGLSGGTLYSQMTPMVASTRSKLYQACKPMKVLKIVLYISL
jgi:hypothetical protein